MLNRQLRIPTLGSVASNARLNDQFQDERQAGSVDESPSTDGRSLRQVKDTGENLSIDDGSLILAGGLGTPAWGDPAIWWTQRSGTPSWSRPSGYDSGQQFEFDVVADNDAAMLVGLSSVINAGGGPTDATTKHALLFASDGNLDVVVAGTTVKADAAAYANGVTYRVKLVIYSAGCLYAISGGAFGTFGTDYTALYEDITDTTAALYPVVSNYDAVVNVDNVNALANVALTFANYVTGIPLTEAQALRDLFRLTAGNAWTNKTNWLSNVAASTWFGLTLSGGKTQQINLNTNNLVGIATGWTPAAFTGLTVFYAYTNPSLSLRFSIADFPAGLTYLDFRGTSTSSVITGDVADFPAGLTILLFYANSTSSVITGDVADFPAGLTYLDFRGTSTSSVITGDVADFPAGLTTLVFQVYSTSSVITGDVADFPAGLTALDFQIYSTSSVITIGATPLPYTAIQSSTLFCSWNQASVDAYLLRMYADRFLFTKTLPTTNISTSNAAPSGVYADEDPPVSGNGAKYELVNDPEGEGFKVHAITTS